MDIYYLRTDCGGDHCAKCETDGNCLECDSTAYNIASPAAPACIGKSSFASQTVYILEKKYTTILKLMYVFLQSDILHKHQIT